MPIFIIWKNGLKFVLKQSQEQNNIPDKVIGDKSIEAVLNEADTIKLKLGENEITPLGLLISLATPGVGFSYEQLKSFPHKAEDFLTAASIPPSNGKSGTSASGKGSKNISNPISSKILQEYCIDKTLQAHQKELQDISGRDAEIKMILEILGRHSKPNVLITGAPGVGKSVLLDGFCGYGCQ